MSGEMMKFYQCVECGRMTSTNVEKEGCCSCYEDAVIDELCAYAEETICGFSPDEYVNYLLLGRGMSVKEAYQHLDEINEEMEE